MCVFNAVFVLHKPVVQIHTKENTQMKRWFRFYRHDTYNKPYMYTHIYIYIYTHCYIQYIVRVLCKYILITCVDLSLQTHI